MTKRAFHRAIYRFTVLTIMALVLGIVVSLAAIAFIECVSWLNEVLLISPKSRIMIQQPILLTAATILVPMLGGLLVGILFQHYSAEKRPLGPPDAIRSVQIRVPLPSVRSGLVSTMASIVSLGCGASVGQYGPMVYLGAIASSLVTRLNLQIPNLRTIAIACGVAAAISTAFNAPIAGLVFAHEVILRHYSLQAFAPTTVASATAYVIANVIFERPPLFLVEFSGVEYSYEFAIFALLGIVCAILAVSFMRLTLKVIQLAPKLKLPAIFRPALAGLIVGLVALELPDVLGVGQEVLRFATIEGAFDSWEMLLLVFAKIGLTALCIGLGFAGGIFSPSLLIGILFGALFWTILELTGLPNSGIVVYAICAMTALTSPIIGAPLTMILIIFELTRNYDLTIATMVAIVFANLAAFRLFGRSMFDVILANSGINLSAGRDQAMLEQVSILDLPINDYVRMDVDDQISTAIQVFKNSNRSEAAVTDLNGTYWGVLRLLDVLDQTDQKISELMHKDWSQFDENTSLWKAMYTIEGFIGEAIPIVSSRDGELLGMITEADLIAAYMKISHDIRDEENEAV